jgi:hypothetical protein
MWRLGENMTTDDLPKFIKELRNHSDYPAICICGRPPFFLWGQSKLFENELNQ